MAEVTGIEGRPFILDFVESTSVDEVKASDASCSILGTLGDLLSSIEREILLRFTDGSEEEEGNGNIASAIAPSAAGLKVEGIASRNSEISEIRFEGEPELAEAVVLTLKLLCCE
jgi:hypothetical protein